MARTSDSAAVPADGQKKRRFGRKRKQRDPNKPSRWQQIKQVFQMTRKADPASVWWMALAFVGVLAVAMVIGLVLDLFWYVTLLGLPLALLAAVYVLSRRAEKAAFSQIEGQPGAVGAVLGSVKRGWAYDTEPVAAEAGGKMRGMRDLHNAAMIYRAVGRPGVVLLAEGPKGPSVKLANAEKRKVSRVVGDGVPVHVMRVGTAEDDVPLSRMVKAMNKLDKAITKQEAAVVQQRLRALGGAKAPIPPGVDPRKVRMDRRALRGR